MDGRPTRVNELLCATWAATGTGITTALIGELDVSNATALSRLLLEWVADAPAGTPLVLELSRLTFVDSSGVQAMVALQRALARSGGTLCLQAPTRAVHLVIDALGLRRELHVQPGPDPAGPDERA